MSKVALFNMAISSVGGGGNLASELDDRKEGELCRLWYKPARDMIFKQTYWPRIKQAKVLVLVRENDFADAWTEEDPPLPWRFSYTAPAGLLNIRYLFCTEEVHQRPEYEFDLGMSATGNRQIYTQVEKAGAVCSIVNDLPDSWEENLRIAVAMQLGAMIAPALSVEPRVITLVEQRAAAYKTMCQEQVANEEEHQVPQGVEILEARHGFDDLIRKGASTRRFYPEADS